MSNDKWTELDLYHGVVGKIKQMVIEGKFKFYAYKFQNQGIRGTTMQTMKSRDFVWKDRDLLPNHIFDTETMEFKLTFLVKILCPNDTSEDPDNYELKKKLQVRYSKRTEEIEETTLDINIEPDPTRFYFPWKDLRAKNVDLNTVIHHYFEQCFLEVPLGILKPLKKNPRFQWCIHNNVNMEEDYDEIVKFYEFSLCFAMTQHKRLGQASQYWDLPDICLDFIQQMLRPQF